MLALNVAAPTCEADEFLPSNFHPNDTNKETIKSQVSFTTAELQFSTKLFRKICTPFLAVKASYFIFLYSQNIVLAI
jgi:hypothetical protein